MATGDTENPPRPAGRTWIFQGDPDAFDVDTYVRMTTTHHWTVRHEQHAARMRVGERVFVWRAQGKTDKPAGIVASGHITAPPAPIRNDPGALPAWDVQLLLDRVAGKTGRMLLRDTLAEDPALSDLRVLGSAGATSRVTDAEAERLEELWGGVQPGALASESEARHAAADHAIDLARAHYRDRGYDVESTAAHGLSCLRGSEEVRVVVKGTEGDGATIEVTAGEVADARGTGWRTDLFVVTASGTTRIIEGWRPSDEDLSPTRYRYRVPPRA